MKQTAQLFRQHDTALEVSAPLVYRQLTREWAALHALPSTAATVRRWGRNEPALMGFTRPGDIVDAIDRGDYARKDELLLALIRQFHGGQQLAGRTVLQAMLPKLAKMALSTHRDTRSTVEGLEEARHVTIAEFWFVMGTYPVERRPERIASNLALDTLRRTTRQREPVAPIPLDPTELGSTRYSGATPLATSTQGEINGMSYTFAYPDASINEGCDLLELIAWGTQTAAITREEGQLLVTAYLPEKSTRCGFDELCVQLNLPRQTVRKRCSRAAKKLTAAVRAEMSNPIDLAPPGRPISHLTVA